MLFNLGLTDRVVRIAVGLLLIALAVAGQIGWWGWLGLLPLVMGIIGFCPVYLWLGINTCKKQPQDSASGTDQQR
ncbi:YgaP family membrane protein [Saezia sanguinis]|uniref:YgaP family membrane protein n=1 Tax=Saezia sanguinis TaxID=1965230 RepID=UPI00304B673D